MTVGSDFLAEADQRRPLVVCVDDERRVLASLERSLVAGDYEVVTTDTPEHALDVVRARPVDVLITDQRMPAMSGIDLAREVHAISPRTAVFLLTAYFDTVSQVALEDLRIERLFTKPWDDVDLREAIRETLTQAPGEVDAGAPSKVVFILCAGMKPAAILDRIQGASDQARESGLQLQVVLEGLPRLEGSVSQLLLELVLWTTRDKTPLIVLDRSGYAETVVNAVGGPSSLLRVMPLGAALGS